MNIEGYEAEVFDGVGRPGDNRNRWQCNIYVKPWKAIIGYGWSENEAVEAAKLELKHYGTPRPPIKRGLGKVSDK